MFFMVRRQTQDPSNVARPDRSEGKQAAAKYIRFGRSGGPHCGFPGGQGSQHGRTVQPVLADQAPIHFNNRNTCAVTPLPVRLRINISDFDFCPIPDNWQQCIDQVFAKVAPRPAVDMDETFGHASGFRLTTISG
jgi:hypothetical protein